MQDRGPQRQRMGVFSGLHLGTPLAVHLLEPAVAVAGQGRGCRPCFGDRFGSVHALAISYGLVIQGHRVITKDHSQRGRGSARQPRDRAFFHVPRRRQLLAGQQAHQAPRHGAAKNELLPDPSNSKKIGFGPNRVNTRGARRGPET